MRAESSAWVETFAHYADNPRKRAFLHYSDLERLVSFAYPTADYEAMRVICDWHNAIFAIDEITDDETEKETAKTMKSHLDGMSGSDGEQSPVYQMCSDIGIRLRRLFGPNAFNRFLKNSQRYSTETAREAKLRHEDKILTFDEYTIFRRSTSAACICLDFIEMVFRFELSDAVLEDEVFKRMYDHTVDFVAWTNDAHSYAMEYSKGHKNANVLTVIMNEQGVDLQRACNRLESIYKSRISQFLADKTDLLGRAWDKATMIHLRQYIFGLECWVSGITAWGFVSGRYFGGDHVSRSLMVKIT